MFLDGLPLPRTGFEATYGLLEFDGDLEAQHARMASWAAGDEIFALATRLLSGRRRQAASSAASLAVHAGQINLYSDQAFSLTLQRVPVASTGPWLIVDACDQIIANVSGLGLRAKHYRIVEEGAALQFVSDRALDIGSTAIQPAGSGALQLAGGRGGWALRFGSAPRLPYQQFHDAATLARMHVTSSRPRDTAQVNALMLVSQLRARSAVANVEALSRNGTSEHVQWVALRTLVALDPVRGIERLEYEAVHGPSEVSGLARQSLPRLRAAMSAIGAT